MKQQIFEVHCNELVAKAQDLCSKHNIDAATRDEICAKCQKGEYSSIEQIQQDVAMVVFRKLDSVTTGQYQAPITTVIETGTNNSSKPKTSFDKLRTYVGKNAD